MASVTLSTVGSIIGYTLGGPLGAVIGQTIGATSGAVIDSYLFAPTYRTSQQGPRLQETHLLRSSEGTPITRGYGHFKVSGNIIWASRFLEEVVKESTKAGGKGGGTKVDSTTYNYYANFAVGLCEGQIQGIQRVWADGRLLDLSEYTYRIYKGTEDQNPDPLIETKEGVGNVPAYRGLAYIVFEDMQINLFGNRIPQMTFEVTKPVAEAESNTTRELVTGVGLLPGATEFGYDTEVVEQIINPTPGSDEVVERRVENNHLGTSVTDWKYALDQLQETLPNCGIITLSATWFGNDLRMGSCDITPKVENSTKNTDPILWVSAGLTRALAVPVSTVGGIPAFGGSPNDRSIRKAILDLKARGFEVMFLPHLLMDIDDTNVLPDPYSDNAASPGQPAYPSRSRITCSPAPGYVGTADKTFAIDTQASSFFGTAAASDFTGSGGTVTYTGPSEWKYRRFVLHMAELCRQSGGVDYFNVGSNLRSATILRNHLNEFPVVEELIDLAGEVASLLPLSKIGYAADWTEYNCYRPDDGTNDVYFHLDPLWSNANIDFVGINNYTKMSDWRDSGNHSDFGTGLNEYGNPQGESIYDTGYLKGQIEGGEDYDYTYSSESNRVSQTRTDITDPIYNKLWVFRQKDLKNWWLNSHYNRPGGVEDPSPTGWVPESKPLIFTEFGCPAINKGSNQPDTKTDLKSVENSIPYFSSGSRDDEIQRAHIQAFIEYWTDPLNNPISGVYADSMISKMVCWAYDARPWPIFPVDNDLWEDASNWSLGHWISGRIDTVYIPDLLRELANDYQVTALTDFTLAYGSCDGYIIQTKTSFRSTVEPLATLFMFNIIESGYQLKAITEQNTRPLVTVTLDDIADAGKEQEPVILTRAQASELPSSMTIRYIDVFKDYEQAAASERRQTIESESDPIADTPVITDYPRARLMISRLLYSAWAKRTSSEFGLLPEFLFLEPGDAVTIMTNSLVKDMRIETVSDSSHRKVTAKSFDRGLFQPGGGSDRTRPTTLLPVSSPTVTVLMDLPILRSIDVPYQPYVASYIKPWSGTNVYKSIIDSDYLLDTTVEAPTIIGETTQLFSSGVTDIWDYDNELEVLIYSESLSSSAVETVLNGSNALGVQNSSGGWEVLQFVTATLIAPRTYRLTKLLRGQLGTEDNMENNLPVGSRVVLLESTLQQLSLGIGDIGRDYFYRYGPSDKPMGDSDYVTVTRSFSGRGLKPFSPVHVKGVVEVDDSITLSWIRRTRLNGDSWEYTDDVPLNEAFEKYEVEVLDSGGNVVRLFSVTDATQVEYTLADQTSDGTTLPFDIVVYQISDQVGRGTGRRVTING